MNHRGQSMVGVLATAAVMGVVMLGFISMVTFQTKANRQIAATGGVNDVSAGITLFFTGSNCSTLGTGNFLFKSNQATVVPGTGSNYSLSIDTIMAGSKVYLSDASSTLLSASIYPYSIAPYNPTTPNSSGIVMTPYPPGGGNQNTTTTPYTYPFQMTINFSSASGPPPLPLTKFVNVYTNASNNVQGMCVVSSGSVPIPPNCTGSNALQWNGSGWACIPVTSGSSTTSPPGAIVGGGQYVSSGGCSAWGTASCQGQYGPFVCASGSTQQLSGYWEVGTGMYYGSYQTMTQYYYYICVQN